jgi:hypothetical protein
MANDGGGVSWDTMKACTSMIGAIRAAEELMAKCTSPSRAKGYNIWVAGRNIKPPRYFPGRFVKTWSANSVGGIGGNPWSAIAVAELDVEDDVLDRLAEVVDG